VRSPSADADAERVQRHARPRDVIAIGRPDGPTPDWLWRDGAIVAWRDASIHIHDFAYGAPSCVFDGIKAYSTASGLQVFRLHDHVRRLFESMKIFRMRPVMDQATVAGAVLDVLRANDFEDESVYVLLLAFWRGGGMDRAFSTPEPDRDVSISVLAWPCDSLLDDTPAGVACGISSWVRLQDAAAPPRVKAIANYQSVRLAYGEARDNGFDTVLMLNSAGKVSEGPGACVFMRRDDVVVTPPVTSDILESITRRTAIELLEKHSGATVLERPIDRTELYVADEAFLAGTGVEIMPIASVDRVPVGTGGVGEVTRRLRVAYRDAVHGLLPEHEHWLTPTNGAR
jgi:branched-chain amino acid aminotransferase